VTLRWARPLPPLLLVVAVLFGGVACGSSDEALAEATPAKQIKQLDASLVPSEILGLPVTQEDQTVTLAGVERSYVDAIGLYSLRNDDLLQATLQISRFNDNADHRDGGFKSSLLAQIGGSRPKAVRMGRDTVYLTIGTRQRIAIWFRDEYLFILSTRDEFTQPRSLLREALEIQP
jgi:hypothetical protein